MKPLPQEKAKKRRIHTWMTKTLSCCIDYASRLCFWTCRLEIKGAAAFAEQVEKGSMVFIFWHDCLFGMIPILRRLGRNYRYSAFVSASRDGLLLQHICRRYKTCEVIAVAHDKRFLALRMMIQRLTEEKTVILLTPDGPRGPAHVIKPGLFFAARKTGAPVMAMSWSASSYWQLRSWDRLRIPKPFSRIVVEISAPITLERETGEEGDKGEQILAQLLESVNKLAAEAAMN